MCLSLLSRSIGNILITLNVPKKRSIAQCCRDVQLEKKSKKTNNTIFTIALCVDRKDENHWPASSPLKIVAKTKIEVAEYADSTFNESLDETTICWKAEDSDGWKLYEQLLPADVDLEQPLTIEFQIIDGDSLTLKDLVNPRLVIITGT